MVILTSHKICSRCVCDTTIKSIHFDDKGECSLCKSHDALESFYKKEKEGGAFQKIVSVIKKKGQGKKYDCIIGISGGTDGTYTLLLAKKFGLRPLAVHFDNGWSKNVAQKNIKKACDILHIDLYTYVVDWEEFKDIQRAFIKAGVPDLEVPTDIGIQGTLYKIAKEEGIKYILSGANFLNEGTVPADWSYIDGTYLKDVHKKFGQKKLKSFPVCTIWDIAVNTFFRKIRQIPILNYIDYSKQKARKELEETLAWEYYGGHHFENLYTHFAVGYMAVKKFGFDRRKIFFSALIHMGEMTREEALAILKESIEFNQKDLEYTVRKLGFSHEEFERIMKSPTKTFHEYKTSYGMLQMFGLIVKILSITGVISPVIYEKYIKK